MHNEPAGDNSVEECSTHRNHSAKARSWNMLGLFEDRKMVSASAAAERTKGQVEGGQVGEGGKDRWCGEAF